jgi:hypothetical protein
MSHENVQVRKAEPKERAARESPDDLVFWTSTTRVMLVDVSQTEITAFLSLLGKQANPDPALLVLAAKFRESISNSGNANTEVSSNLTSRARRQG